MDRTGRTTRGSPIAAPAIRHAIRYPEPPFRTPELHTRPKAGEEAWDNLKRQQVEGEEDLAGYLIIQVALQYITAWHFVDVIRRVVGLHRMQTPSCMHDLIRDSVQQP